MSKPSKATYGLAHATALVKTLHSVLCAVKGKKM